VFCALETAEHCALTPGKAEPCSGCTLLGGFWKPSLPLWGSFHRERSPPHHSTPDCTCAKTQQLLVVSSKIRCVQSRVQTETNHAEAGYLRVPRLGRTGIGLDMVRSATDILIHFHCPGLCKQVSNCATSRHFNPAV